jgi:hypothetical protein
MKKTIIRLGNPLADGVVRQMTIVADSNMTMAGILPRIEMALHDMTIRATCWIVAQIAPTLAISKCKCTDARKYPEHHG